MADDQQAVIAFLSNPSTYPDGVGAIERLETHISLVFLAGDRVYKLKRAVAFSYVDFLTLERRRQACEAEFALNRRTAPQLYLEVRAISRGADGRLAWGEAGEIVDWIVVLRRFDQDRRLDVIAASGGLTPPLLHALADHIAAFHANAERRPDHGGVAGLTAIADNNDACLGSSGIFSAEDVRELRDLTGEWFTRHGPLLDRRRAEGRVRHGHGDLHLRNICVLDDKPVLYDCLEFSDALGSIDVLYDLAFLLMDLEHQGHGAAANRVFNRYLELTDEADGLAAMPLFLSLRAAIRAHVTVSAGGDPGEARAYLDQARAALRPAPARLVAVGGLSGTGKSTVAAGLAPELGARPGARVLRSDVIRKRLFGMAPEAHLPAEAYTAEVTERVYGALRRQAADALRAGYCAIIDAVSLRPGEREAFAAVARDVGAPFIGIWLEAPARALTGRVEARRNDASDATATIVERQLQTDPGPLDWHCIDAGGAPDAVLAAARRKLG